MNLLFPPQECPHCRQDMDLGSDACPWCGRDPLVPSSAPAVVALLCVAASVTALFTGGFSYANYAVDMVGWLFPMN